MKDKDIIHNDFLAGVSYGDFQLVDIKVGDKVDLVHERGNIYDKNAIRVDFNGRKLGYIKRDRTADIHNAKKAGRKIEGYITAIHRNNPSWRQVTLRVLADKVTQPADEKL